MKRCSGCKKLKNLSEFHKDKSKKDRLYSSCKMCTCGKEKKYRENNREKVNILQRKCYQRDKKKQLEWSKIYQKKNKKKLQVKRKEWEIENKQHLKEYYHKYYLTNKKHKGEIGKEYKEKNRERINTLSRKWRRKNKSKLNKQEKIYRSLPKIKISRTMSRSIYNSLKGNKNGCHWESLIKFTLNDLIVDVESKFKPGMTWDNYGKWHLDHRIPISLWEFESYTDREFKQCFSLANYQPLWAFENLSKNNTIPPDEREFHG